MALQDKYSQISAQVLAVDSFYNGLTVESLRSLQLLRFQLAKILSLRLEQDLSVGLDQDTQLKQETQVQY